MVFQTGPSCLWPHLILGSQDLGGEGRPFSWSLAFSVFLPSSCPLPPQLVKTAELPPDRNYVLGSHPHGIIAVGTVCNFATEGTGLSQVFPGLRFSLAVLNCLLYLPGHREYFLSCGEFELSDRG